ncbi:MAG: hypothetical protein DRI86_00940 [Bacteroidetes bacterium]|nr:MAG: hypothetical protein DRI86_00940 [Bacteroidota bacterium]
MLKFTGKNVGQFAQIEKGDISDINGVKGSKIFLKRISTLMPCSDGSKHILSVPVMTGNGIRGSLRREMTALVLESLVEKGLSCGKKLINAHDFNLMNAGGGNDYQAQPLAVENKVRELNPVISIFGTSLAVSGKISTPNALPYIFNADGEASLMFNENKDVTTKEIKYIYSPLISTETFVKGDDILQGKENSNNFLSEDEVIEWRESVSDSQKARSDERASVSKDKKTSKVGLQAYLGREYVISGTSFHSYLEATDKMTDLEIGMFILTLERFVTKKFGSTKSRGFGAFEYSFLFDDGSKMSTKIDMSTSKTSDIYRDYSKEIESQIKLAKKWLVDISCENVKMTDILKKK